MDEYTKYIILMHLHWIKKGFTKKDISKIHNLVTSEDPFQNVTIKKMQKEMGGQIEYKDSLQSSDYEQIKFLYLNYSERVLDLSFLKYCVNLEEIVISNQKLKNLNALENLEKIRIIDASSNEIENIDILYSFNNLEEINLEYNPILSLKSITHLNKLKHIKIDEISNEKEIFPLLKNSKNCFIDYIIKGNTLDYENFIFPKYHIGFSRNEGAIKFFMIGMNDNYKNSFSSSYPIKFPENFITQPDFYDRYIFKIKKETKERLEAILGMEILINGTKMFYDKDLYSFSYEHII